MAHSDIRVIGQEEIKDLYEALKSSISIGLEVTGGVEEEENRVSIFPLPSLDTSCFSQIVQFYYLLYHHNPK